jgi:hypothetical protein
MVLAGPRSSGNFPRSLSDNATYQDSSSLVTRPYVLSSFVARFRTLCSVHWAAPMLNGSPLCVSARDMYRLNINRRNCVMNFLQIVVRQRHIQRPKIFLKAGQLRCCGNGYEAVTQLRGTKEPEWITMFLRSTKGSIRVVVLMKN